MMRRNNSVSSFDVCGELDMGNVLSVIVFRRIEILLYFIVIEYMYLSQDLSLANCISSVHSTLPANYPLFFLSNKAEERGQTKAFNVVITRGALKFFPLSDNILAWKGGRTSRRDE